VGAFGDLNAQATQAIALDNCFTGTIKILGTTGRSQASDAESKKTAPEIMPNAALSLRAPVKILAASSIVKSSPESGQLPTLSRAIPVPDGYESAYGTLVHKMLELRVMARSAREEHFARLIRAEAKVNFDESIGKRLIAMATNEVDQLTGSDSWREIFTGVRLARAELPVAAIENQTLITAKIDLLLTYHDGRHLIVDYKTSAVRPDHARDLCDGRGYTDQVRQYVDIAKKALRATNVTGAILFTESGHLERI
jgi:ATP-dependent exoDNAse (exonuclease V) beta subunit